MEISYSVYFFLRITVMMTSSDGSCGRRLVLYTDWWSTVQKKARARNGCERKAKKLFLFLFLQRSISFFFLPPWTVWCSVKAPITSTDRHSRAHALCRSSRSVLAALLSLDREAPPKSNNNNIFCSSSSSSNFGRIIFEEREREREKRAQGKKDTRRCLSAGGGFR